MISAAARDETRSSCSGEVGECSLSTPEAEPIQRLLRRGDLGSGSPARLDTQLARCEDARWPKADLINSSYALPFCPPNQFGAVWHASYVRVADDRGRAPGWGWSGRYDQVNRRATRTHGRRCSRPPTVRASVQGDPSPGRSRLDEYVRAGEPRAEQPATSTT